MKKNEIRILLIAVLAIASVSLITQAISGLVAGISIRKDFGLIRMSGIGKLGYNEDYIKIISNYIFIVTAIAFISTCSLVLSIIFNKLKKVKIINNVVGVGICCATVIVFIALALSSKFQLPQFNSSYPDSFDNNDYELFQSFLTIGIADVIAILLAYGSRLLLNLKCLSIDNSYSYVQEYKDDYFNDT